MPLSPDDKRLVRLARAQLASISDPELAEVWDVLCSEIEAGRFPAKGWFSVEAIIDVLSAGSGRGVNDLSVSVDDEGGEPERVIVCSGFVLPRDLACPRGPLLAELRRLLDRFREG
jgi:hypothetical protein